jgi:Tfp pilus assembly protein PilX
MTRARDEQGFVLVSAVVLLTVMMGLGLGLLLFADNQQHAASGEQGSEEAFNIAEAALNAQVGQISRAWPGEVKEALPSSCTATTSTSTERCPSPASLTAGYPKAGSTNCPTGTKGDAWGSSLSNPWTTYVRATSSESTFFNSKTEETQPTWAKGEAGKPAKLWVRAVGVAKCRVVTLVTLVSQQYITANFPKEAVSGNWFETSNKGNKLIINTQGKASQAGGVSMRCSGFTGTEKEIEEKCKNYDKAHGQVSPDTTNAAPSPSPTQSATQLEAYKEQAKWAKAYYGPGECPGSMEELSGLPAYVTGPCELSYTKGTANSAASPGFLIIINGTLTLNGNSQFYGAIYAANQQNTAAAVVTVHGTTQVVGSITVDGNGGISFGSSAENMEYNPEVIAKILTYAGATPTRNSFRVLPITQ